MQSGTFDEDFFTINPTKNQTKNISKRVPPDTKRKYLKSNWVKIISKH